VHSLLYSFKCFMIYISAHMRIRFSVRFQSLLHSSPSIRVTTENLVAVKVEQSYNLQAFDDSALGEEHFRRWQRKGSECSDLAGGWQGHD